ncbi:hypothetical protein [Methylococcus capsulatus]|uniref:hypothetical protein n=1 Tax=Methylococcus capsulatus TaxID=414 RepID=UPI0002D61B53|nr:hypothetical protein [Methylococcus capsulatus]
MPDAKAGKKAGLPDEAVVPTFDGGYASFYHSVFFAAEMAIPPHRAGGIVDGPPDGGAVAPDGDFVLKRESLPGWEQVRERAFRAG